MRCPPSHQRSSSGHLHMSSNCQPCPNMISRQCPDSLDMGNSKCPNMISRQCPDSLDMGNSKCHPSHQRDSIGPQCHLCPAFKYPRCLTSNFRPCPASSSLLPKGPPSPMFSHFGRRPTLACGADYPHLMADPEKQTLPAQDPGFRFEPRDGSHACIHSRGQIPKLG